jgi:hypothetical protein
MNAPTAHFVVPEDPGEDFTHLKSIVSIKQSQSVTRGGFSHESAVHTLTLGSLSKKGCGYYQGMIPSFTNTKRMKLYNNDPKRGGFTFVNWDIEEELWRFQKEIETKFKASIVNKKFKFPLNPEHTHEIPIKTGIKDLKNRSAAYLPVSN